MTKQPEGIGAKFGALGQKAVQELGLLSVYRSSVDTKLLIAQRFVRYIGYGASALILVSYLENLGFSDSRIGLFMTLTLVGDVVISLVLTMITDSVGRRMMLAVGCALMALSGITFGIFENYWILLATAVIGVISPSGNEIGPFRAIEESILSHLSPALERTDIFTWYSLVGTMGMAVGVMVCGWTVDSLLRLEGWDRIHAHRIVFFGYGVMGFLKLLLTICLSSRCEIDPDVTKTAASEETRLLQGMNSSTASTQKKALVFSFSSISPERRIKLATLTILFGLDAFASSLAPISWITSFVQRKFSIDEGSLGTIFFGTSLVGTISIPFAAPLARRLGNVRTMMFTHLPSAVSLVLLGAPNSLALVVTLLIVHSGSRFMEVAPRSAFVASVLRPSERTAVMGAIGVVRTGSTSLGPVITGFLAEHNLFWIAFCIAGTLKLIYDFTLLIMFVNLEGAEETEDTAQHASTDVSTSRGN